MEFGFLLVGSQVVCLKTRIADNDLAWTALRETGITSVFHLPCLPATIEEAQLPMAKPAAGEAGRNPEAGQSSQLPEQRQPSLENPSLGPASTSLS